MKIGAILPYFGGKRTLAATIVETLGSHRCYWEPFCGSLAVLLAKEPSTWEFVNDLNGDAVNLARCLQDEQTAIALYERAERTLFVEQFSGEAREQLLKGSPAAADAPMDPERAYWYLRFSWFSRNGTAGTPLGKTGAFCVRYSATGGDGARRWRSVVESMPAWHQRLRHVTILGPSDSFDIIPRIQDAPRTVIYCDPPYFAKSASYLHDFDELVTFTEDASDKTRPLRKIDKHELLAWQLSRFQHARVVVSYYMHERLATLYSPDRWRIIECPTAKSMANAGRRDLKGSTLAPEVLLVNDRQPGLFQE